VLGRVASMGLVMGNIIPVHTVKTWGNGGVFKFLTSTPDLSCVVSFMTQEIHGKF
jgi:hypothetical protein